MNGPTVLLFAAVIAILGTAAILLVNAGLDERLERRRADAEMRRSMKAERERLAALRGPRVLR